MMAKILPYVNAVMIVINELLSMLAKLVGYKETKWDFDVDTESISAGFEDLGGAIGGVGEEADNTRQKLLGLRGFDKLNVIKTPTESRGGGASGGGGAGGINPNLLNAFDKIMGNYDSKLKGIKTRAQEIADNIMKWLGFTKDADTGAWKFDHVTLGTVLGTVGLIGLGIGAWKKTLDILKIPKTFLSNLGKVKKGVEDTKTIWDKLGIPKVGFSGVLISAVVQTLNLKKQADDYFDSLKKGKGLWDAVFPKNGWDYVSKKVAQSTANMLMPFSNLIIAGNQTGAVIEKIGEKIGIVKKKSSKDIDEGIKKFNSIKKPIQEVSYDISQLKLNVKVDDKVKQDVEKDLNTLTTTIYDKTNTAAEKMKKNLTKMYENGLISEEDYKKSLEKIDGYYGGINKKTQEAQDKINEILQNATGRELREDEIKEIDKYFETIQKNSVKALSENKAQQEVILKEMQKTNTNITKETASKMISNAIEARDKTIKAAEDQYNKTMVEAQKMLDIGAINEEQYDKIQKNAEETRDKAIEDANKQYDDTWDAFEKNQTSIADYIDKDTGKVKSNWQKFWDDIGKKPDNSLKNAEDGIDKHKTTLKSKWNTLWGALGGVHLPTPHISWREWGGQIATGGLAKLLKKLGLPTSMPSMDVQWYAQGGLPDVGQMFIANERGPELVGQIGGKSFVANQNQMMDIIDKKLSSAGGLNNATFVIQVGDEQVAKKVLKDLNGMAKANGKPITISG